VIDLEEPALTDEECDNIVSDSSCTKTPKCNTWDETGYCLCAERQATRAAFALGVQRVRCFQQSPAKETDNADHR
jgi:hypothetical protein